MYLVQRDRPSVVRGVTRGVTGLRPLLLALLGPYCGACAACSSSQATSRCNIGYNVLMSYIWWYCPGRGCFVGRCQLLAQDGSVCCRCAVGVLCCAGASLNMSNVCLDSKDGPAARVGGPCTSNLQHNRKLYPSQTLLQSERSPFQLRAGQTGRRAAAVFAAARQFLVHCIHTQQTFSTPRASLTLRRRRSTQAPHRPRRTHAHPRSNGGADDASGRPRHQPRVCQAPISG